MIITLAQHIGCFLIVFLAGVSLLNLISGNFSFFEKLGFGFPLGFGIITVLMFMFELVSVKFNLINLLTASVILIIAFNSAAFKRKARKDILSIKIPDCVKNFSLWKINLPWLLMAGVLGYIIYGITAKTLFWQPLAYDTLTGYDYMAKVMAAEGVIKNSIFSAESPTYSIRASYPPFVSGSFAFAYLCGLKSSTITGSILFLSLIVIFYTFLKKYVTHTNAVFFTLLMVITPEMLAMSALSLSNCPQVFFTFTGIISLFLWLDKGDRKYLYLGSISLALNVWARSDGIVFIFAGACMLLYDMIKNNRLKDIKSWKPLILPGIITLLPFISWQLFISKSLGVTNSNVFVAHLFWDADKFSELYDLVSHVVKSTQYYGLVFYLFPIVLIINIKYILKDKTALLTAIFSAFFLYTFMYYQMDNGGKAFGYALRSMIFSSFKRGMFPIIPIICYYMSSSKMVDSIFRKII